MVSFRIRGMKVEGDTMTKKLVLITAAAGSAALYLSVATAGSSRSLVYGIISRIPGLGHLRHLAWPRL